MELDEHLNFDVREGIGWLTLDRPEAKNAMTKSMYAGIRDVCRRVSTDEEIQVLVIQGVSGAFTVGGDLKEVLEMLREGDAAGVVAYGDYLPFEALRSLPKPTIASINGLCMGGGLTLALMCDIRIATSQSRFAIPEAKVGIVESLNFANVAWPSSPSATACSRLVRNGMPVMSAPTQKMYGLPVIAMNAGSPAAARSYASDSDCRPAGPKLLGFL